MRFASLHCEERLDELLPEDPLEELVAVELIEYGEWLADKRRARPENDLVSTLVHAEIDGERLTEAELANFFALLVIAGNATTPHSISHGMLALA